MVSDGLCKRRSENRESQNKEEALGEEGLGARQALGRDTLSETENRKEATVTGGQWQVGAWALTRENREGSRPCRGVAHSSSVTPAGTEAL